MSTEMVSNNTETAAERLANSPPDLKQAAKLAEIRFGRISPVLNKTYAESSATQYYKRIALIPMTLPDGRTVKYSYKTYQKWEASYRKYGLEGLIPRERKDCGTSRALSDEAEMEICRLLEKYPHLSGARIREKLIEEGYIPSTVSVDAVQRFIKKNDLRTARNPEVRDRKAFEEDAFGKMWQADTCYFPCIKEDGKVQKVYCVGIVDDHTRMEVGADLFYNDNAENFQIVLKQAIETFGIPTKLLVDNGAPYANEQLSLICVALGITLIHARPRDGATKGKVERSWKSHRGLFLADLDVDEICSLDDFRKKWLEYKTKYNTQHVNRMIGCTAYERYEKSEKHVRIPKSREWLEDCFLNRITRKVNNDSTVSIDTVSYDVPPQFIKMRVEIRFVPGDMSTACILYAGKKYPITKTDRVANGHMKRKSSDITIDYGRIEEESRDV